MEKMNEFDGFVMPQARMLPVILLLDVSGSMSYDSKMDELNNSVREMIESFKKEQIVQADICVSIVTFGSEFIPNLCRHVILITRIWLQVE